MGMLIASLKQQIKSNYLFLIVFPILGSLLIGNLLTQQQRQLAIPIAIVDLDQTDYSQSVLEKMKNQPRIIVQEVSQNKASTMLSKNEVDSVFLIKKGFKEQVLLEEREQIIELWISPTTVASGFVQEVFASEVMKLTSAVMAANKVAALYEQSVKDNILAEQKWEDALEYNHSQWKPQPLMTVDYVQGENLEDDEIIYSPYIGLWSFFTMLVCFLLTDWFVKERDILFSRIRSSWKGLDFYLIQRASATLVLQLIQVCISYVVFMQVTDTGAFLLLSMILYVLYTMLVVLVIASMMKQVGSYYAVGLLLSFFVAILGGSFFPVEEIIPSLEQFTVLLPNHIFFITDQIFTRILSCLIMIISMCFLWLLVKWRI